MNLLKTRRLPAFLLSLCLLCGCGANAISEKEAKTLAFDSVNVQEESVVSMKVESSNLDGEDTYVIIFQTADKNYQIILSKQTGEILRSSYQSIDSVSSSETDPTDQNEQESPSEISLEQAKTIVLKDAGIHASAATFTKEKKDQDHGTIVYELEFKTSDTYYEYEISINGMILEVDMEIFDYRSATGNEISMEEAIQKVLAKVKGASRENIHIEEDWDDGMHLFEGELYYDHTKYEFEIDAATGTLLEWSMETQG